MARTVPQLHTAYRECRLITRRAATNFYYAFITLPDRKRRAIYATYAFCRLCDDASDAPMPREEKLARLDSLRSSLSEAYAGRPDGPVFTALADTASVFEIPEEYFQEVVSGVEMDLTKTRYQDFDELRTYCYRVASVVGLACLHIFGFSEPRAREYAVDLGLAMQITNIMRDVREDMERDRVYLPMDEVRSTGYSEEELRQGVLNEPFRDLMAIQARRARAYYESGAKLLPLLSPRSRACPAVLGKLYSLILDRIERQGFDVFTGRVGLSRREKYLVTVQTWIRSLLPMAQHPT